MQDQTVIPETTLRQRVPSRLDAIFAPNNVAVIGASERRGSVGRTILWNLISNPFGGAVFPVNPKRSNILGIKAYPDIASVPEPVDLAVVVTPAQTVPGIIRECVEAGVKGAIIISAGFKERGAAGAELERQIMAEARKGEMRIIGPNCLGVQRPLFGLNATFASAMARPGNIGFISQSGALCTAVLDWSFSENVGFSAFISIGSMLDVGWGDLIDYLGNDPQTQSIVIYMESVGDAASFMSAAREVALTKPIIVIKAGRTAAAAQAAASHTGSLTGSDEVLDAAFRRSGVLRVDRISDMFNMAEVLSKQPRPKGPRLAIVTNAGGPGVLATDQLIQHGGQLAQLSEETMERLNHILPEHWSHGNPIDILGDADETRYAETLEAVAKDPNTDGMLVILTPQAMSNPTRTAELLKNYASIDDKPILASWMGGPEVAAGISVLNRTNIPTFNYPDTAATMFMYMWRYTSNLRALYETPSLQQDPEEIAPNRELVKQIIDKVRQSGREILTEYESKQVLAAYFIPTVETRLASSPDEAVEAAEAIGYPVVLKLNSETITHKTDVGGVKLNLGSAENVREAYRAIEESVNRIAGEGHFQGVTVQPMAKLEGYEVIIGSSIDPQFGPVLLFGSGGQLVEVYKDRALALPPLNTTLARLMMEQTKIYTALKGVRGRPPVDLAALENLVVRFSQLVVEQPWIKEIDINPLLASHEQLLALDARIVLHDKNMTEERLPRPAIRPYPVQYVKPWTMRDGRTVLIRPIRPEDEPLLVRFHENLSERTVYLRYLKDLKLSQRVAHERLARLSFIDYNREMALVAVERNPENQQPSIVAVGRLSKYPGTDIAEFAIVVADDHQGLGLGRELLTRLLQVGRDEKLSRIRGNILQDNEDMLRLTRDLGFTLTDVEGEPIVRAEIKL
ncbi:MAG: bifunctional acetate--CoA ligase family protein/GNAT family N-acetyltransferase [Chloroflexota bacterium]|nr:MAG: acetyl CoA synthetase subunit alpha [Chloroflexota bacterium]